MILAYYRDAAGKITNCHEVSGIGMDVLQQKVEEYNANPKGGGRTAHIADLAAGSFEEYLYFRTKARTEGIKDTIQAALDAIEEARDAVEALRV